MISIQRACFRVWKSIHFSIHYHSSWHSRVVFTLLISPAFLAVFVSASRGLFVASDPGPRGGLSGAGGPLPGLSERELKLFLAGQDAIQEIDSVTGTVPDTGHGLGPRFNMDSCGGCHNFPAPGGSSPPVNPMISVATKNGATNTVPFFITLDGPIRRAFLRSMGGQARGTDLHLFTISGRSDAPGCDLAQPDFDSLAPQLAFHVPLPLYGDGLIESISTDTIVANLASNSTLKRALGIAGRPGGINGSGRFLWKGQGARLELLAAGGYQNEVGVTNALIPREDDPAPSCQFNALPEDTFDSSASNFIEGLPDFAKIAGFVRFSAPPDPIQDTPSITSGRTLFNRIGCALCHTPSLQTGESRSRSLNFRTVGLYSDLALHRMGPGLADGIPEGNAGADDFRTPPLWGLGQRIFFLHDGRTSDLLEAIQAHTSEQGGSEADKVIGAFNTLSEEQKQDILNFLRSL
ncbi:MAG: thiol oxidoreductase [Planctomycetes bacterium]|nr:thiol oxidoreductase [Planctomycetota bacterium]MBI3832924.1 thiol oxidoreductase [Planctomycetota bacterium]